MFDRKTYDVQRIQFKEKIFVERLTSFDRSKTFIVRLTSNISRPLLNVKSPSFSDQNKSIG